MINLTVNSTFMLIITIGIVLFIGIMVFIVMYKDRKKDEEEIDELLSDLRKDRKEKEVIAELEKEIKQEEVQEVKNIEEPIQKEEIKEQKFEEKKSEIEEMLEKMQEDLDKKPEDVVTNFENEQEEKAIISYQELLDSIKEKSPKVEVVDMKLEIKNNHPIDELEYRQEKEMSKKLNETIQAIENNETNKIVEEEKTETNAVKKFKNTDFISPVYGKMNEHLEYPTVPSFEKHEQVEFDFDDDYFELENRNIDDYLEEYNFKNNMEINTLEQTLDMPPISKEIKKNDEFLQALKEFRKNLD